MAQGTGQWDAAAGSGCCVLLRCSGEEPEAALDKLTTGFCYGMNSVCGDAKPRGAVRSPRADMGTWCPALAA